MEEISSLYSVGLPCYPNQEGNLFRFYRPIRRGYLRTPWIYGRLITLVFIIMLAISSLPIAFRRHLLTL